MKKFEISFTTDPESGIYSANLVNATSAEQATAYYMAQGYTVAGCRETTSDPKPGQPVITIPEDWKAPQETTTRTAEEITADIIPALRAEIHDLDKSISNLLKLVEKGAESDTLATRLTDLEKQKRDCKRRLIVAEDDYIILEREHIIWWLSKFLDGDIEDEDFRRQLIDLLVNSVTVWDEPDGWYKITAVYNLIDQNTQTFRVKPDGSSDLRGQLPPSEE